MLLKVDSDLAIEDIKVEFAKELFELVDKNRLRLKKFLGWLDNINNAKDEVNFIAGINKDVVLNFVIKLNDKIIGTIDFHDCKEDNGEKVADIGYWLDVDFEGKGVMNKCCKVLIKYGFEELKLDKIFIHCDIRNIKSENVAKNLGFKFVREIKNHYNLYGVFSNAKEYVLDK